MTSLLVLSAALLVVPWVLRSSSPRQGERVEIHGALRLLWWLNRAYCAGMHRLVLLNEAPLPEHGPAILVANHTSGIDNFVLQAGCQRVLGFMIAKEFHENFAIHPMSRLLRCIPVQRDGRDLSAMREALRALEAGRVLPIFPEGKITPKSGREFGPSKPGAAFLTIRSGVPVIPAYIRGTPETKTVWTAIVTPSKVRVLFGEPLDLAEFRIAAPDRDHEKAQVQALAERLMDAIKALRDESLAREATL